MKVFLVVVAVAWFHAGGVNCGDDYHHHHHHHGPPLRSVAIHYGHPVALAPAVHKHDHHDDYHGDHVHHLYHSDGPRTYVEYAEYDNGPSGSPPPPSKHNDYKAPRGNSITSSDGSKPGFEVVRAPVIYHQTVTDNNSDLTRAVADAFGVVQGLRKPVGRQQQQQDGYKQQPARQQEGGYGRVNIANIELVNQAPPPQRQQSRPGVTTTTTTIVDIPQQVLPQRAPTSSQQLRVPSTTGLTPPPAPSAPRSTSAPLTTSTVARLISDIRPSAVPLSPLNPTPSTIKLQPKLIIPSQPHVTTLVETVKSVDPQGKTIIQPVYIPYPVDQNGHPVGPLPDYQNMDFNALLSAQQNLLTVAPHPAPAVQYVEAHHQPQQLHVQQVQAVPQLQQVHVQQPQQQIHIQQLPLQQPQQQLQYHQQVHIEQPQQLQIQQFQVPQAQQLQLQQVEVPQAQQLQIQQVEVPQQPQQIQYQQPQQQLQIQQVEVPQQPQQLQIQQVEVPQQLQQIQFEQPQQQLLYVQQDQTGAAATPPESSPEQQASPSPASPKFGRRVRRLKKVKSTARPT